ncbi:polyprenyl synthetase family protein [Actinocorallia aurantiaca]|uniref:Family 2 encapsulin nanocompartment cargo protein polyprenyl transferase n=1 Tax=Actinocorallia aurantiaca TaxID=46204 RepID=A0ABN3U0D9_9ACTN
MSALHEVSRPAPEILGWGRTLVEPALREAVGSLPDTVRLISGYHLGWWDAEGRPTGSGGKALRPTLALLAARAVGGRAEDAVPAAVAVELIHDFSLLHDDVMDGDETRRHRPAAWRVFGTNPAILTGDVLLALAMETLAAAGGPTRVLTTGVLDLLHGQNLDMSFETRDDVLLSECVAMAVGKTGALMRCACALGADAGGGTPDQVAAFALFGEHLGLAFQHMDDLLGIWGDPAETGKPVYSDLLNRKKSLPVVAALTSGTRAARALHDLYRTPGAFDPAEAAALVEAAGGRSWSLDRLTQLRNQALATLRSVSPDPMILSELTTLADLVIDRAR